MKNIILITAAVLMASASAAQAAQWCKPHKTANGIFSCKYESATFNCASQLKPDGCSAPENIAKNIVPRYNQKFKSACFNHDMCYYFGSTKATCDAKFLALMNSSCKSNDKECGTVAKAYYAAVVAAPIAKQAYDGGQNHRRRHCSGQNIGEKVAGTTKRTVKKTKKAVVKSGKKLAKKIGGIFK